MNILKALLGEHGVFYAQFAHLEQSLPQAQEAGVVKAQGALLAAGLASHAALENEVLFAMLEARQGKMGPVTVMRMEHQEIEALLQGVQEAEGLERARDGLLEALRLAREHFAKEEQVLFPMAANMLSPSELREAGDRWAERRKVGVRLSRGG
jgi:iron-sulfur cluster repair protein YtfE (RIC family)